MEDSTTLVGKDNEDVEHLKKVKVGTVKKSTDTMLPR
jgi:hypothetical protein